MSKLKEFTADELSKLAPAIQRTSWDEHEADQARRKALRDARRDEMIRCLDPGYSATRELEKDHFQWTVEANWLGTDANGRLNNFETLPTTVIAQNERDAWAMFCDKIGMYPSSRDCKKTITRGKKVDAAKVAATHAHGEIADGIPTTKIGGRSSQLPVRL